MSRSSTIEVVFCTVCFCPFDRETGRRGRPPEVCSLACKRASKNAQLRAKRKERVHAH